MDKLRLTLLFDFYSALLTEKQSLFFELYFFNDLSLNEIAEQYGISPQAVSDLLKRTAKLLEDYEGKLNLLEKHNFRLEKVRELTVFLDKQSRDTESQNHIKELLAEISE